MFLKSFIHVEITKLFYVPIDHLIEDIFIQRKAELLL